MYTKSTQDRFRQYGLWERYADLYPNSDLVYTVGVDNYQKDWYFAHGTRYGLATQATLTIHRHLHAIIIRFWYRRKVSNLTYQPTTWQIRFSLQDIKDNRNYRLVLALASANQAELQVQTFYIENTQTHIIFIYTTY